MMETASTLAKIKVLQCLRDKANELKDAIEGQRWKKIALLVGAGTRGYLGETYCRPSKGDRFHGEDCAQMLVYWRGDVDRSLEIPWRWLDESKTTDADIEREQAEYDAAVNRSKEAAQRRADEAALQGLLKKLGVTKVEA